MLKRTKHDNNVVNVRTKAWLLDAEDALGYPLTIVQGSYHTGVGPSAGTHDGGGVVDLLFWDFERKCKVLRKLGVAAWPRRSSEGPWNEHIHVVDYDDPELSASAKRQADDYLSGKDGLAGHGPDTFDFRPNPISHYAFPRLAPPKRRLVKPRRLVKQAVEALEETLLQGQGGPEAAAFRKALLKALQDAPPR